jgi:hypothetical protein
VTNDIGLNDYIGQYNNGFHNDLFSDVRQYLKGKDVLVPIVTEQVDGIDDGPDSCGGGWRPAAAASRAGPCSTWSMPVGGSDKHIYGYFVDADLRPGGTVADCGGPCETRSFGNYTPLPVRVGAVPRPTAGPAEGYSTRPTPFRWNRSSGR